MFIYEKKFRTYIVTFPKIANLIKDLGIDGEWRLSVNNDASFRFWSASNNEDFLTTHFGAITDEMIRKFKKQNCVQCKEVIIETDSESKATNVASLIQTGTLLAFPNPITAPRYFGAVEICNNSNLKRDKSSGKLFSFQENAYYACQIAMKAWKDKSIIYAIEKYRLSLELNSFTPHSAFPIHGQVFLNEYPEYSSHVRAATAFLLAYSVIEELELEIRSSNKKPRWLKDRNWNPEVKKDVEDRLRQKGIDLSESVIWLYRGNSLLSSESLDARVVGKIAEYSDGNIIRDKEMDVIDALHDASYIRNFILAHKYDDLVKHLGPYDVHNVQSLARRLILSSLNLYKSI